MVPILYVIKVTKDLHLYIRNHIFAYIINIKFIIMGRDKVKDINQLIGLWEFYDFLTPRPPKFFRYRVLFFEWVLENKANGDMKEADNLLLKATNRELYSLYAEFYNLTLIGKENPITPEMVGEIDIPTKEDQQSIREAREDFRAHMKGLPSFTETMLENWKKELMA